MLYLLYLMQKKHMLRQESLKKMYTRISFKFILW